MRHKKIGRKLNRNSSHRKSMFINMSNSLIKFEIIKTTLFKAKELRRYIEYYINIAKNNNLFSKRMLFNNIRNKSNVDKLINFIAPRFINRSGGYTRIIKCCFRNGDKSSMAYIEIIK